MSSSDADIRTVEIAAARAWPATESTAADGWLLRRTPTVDRARNNSALPPPHPLTAGDGLAAAVDAVERWYAARDAKAQVQVSPLAWHDALDALLDARGYAVAYGADVLIADAGDVPADVDDAVSLLPAVTPDWLDAWAACEERDRASCEAQARAIFDQVSPRATFALHHDDEGAPVAVGVVVRDPGIAGIFCMATHPDHRGHGHATRVLRSLVADGVARGAERFYLQMDSRNETAHGLYARHGFTWSHAYHFRLAR